MKVREVIRLLEKHGWLEMRSRASHRHFKHPDEAFVITVPGNDGKELAPGTLNVILKKAGLNEGYSRPEERRAQEFTGTTRPAR